MTANLGDDCGMSALSYLRIGNLDDAERIAEKELQTLNQEAAPKRFLHLSFVLTEVLRIRGQCEDALNHLDSLSSWAPRDAESLVGLGMHRGYCCAILGNYRVARTLLDEAERLALRTELLELHGEVKVRQAMLAYLEEDFVTSGKLYGAVADCYGDRFGWYLQSTALGGVGKCLMAQRFFQEALPWLHRAIGLAESAGAHYIVARNRSELGVCYLGLGDPSRALEAHLETEKVFLRLGTLHAYQVNLADIGNVYLERKEFLTAIAYYQRALAIAKEIKAPASIEKWSFNLRLAYRRMQKSIGENVGVTR